MVNEPINAKNIDELYAKVAELQIEVNDLLFSGNIDIASNEFLIGIKKRFEIAEIKKEIALRELENDCSDEYVRSIKNILINLNFEKDRNYYEESGYRWALAQIEKASPNPMISYIPEGLIENLKNRLATMEIDLSVNSSSIQCKQNVKDLILKRGRRTVEIGKTKALLETELENYEKSFSSKKRR